MYFNQFQLNNSTAYTHTHDTLHIDTFIFRCCMPFFVFVVVVVGFVACYSYYCRYFIFYFISFYLVFVCVFELRSPIEFVQWNGTYDQALKRLKRPHSTSSIHVECVICISIYI